MQIQVTVQLSADVAHVLHRRAPPTTESQELSQILDSLGVELEAMHPGVEDPILATWFVIETPDPATAEQVVARLQRRAAVEAAFIKPPDELP